jgi:FdrA protein
MQHVVLRCRDAIMILRSERRPGAYYDSIVLMRLQSALGRLPGVADAGVAMATEANLALLSANGLLPDGAAAVAEDLLVVVKAETEAAADGALAEVDALLARRRAAAGDDYRPRSLETAVKMLPEASWVLVSVPGRYAAGVAHRALDLRRHVFLYSDNVSLDDEVALKRRARELGLLVMGPDCGTAIVGGTGLGFANRVRRGAIGLVGASGTGLQAITAGIHAKGAGVSQAIGTGGRDLSAEVGAITALQGLDLLARDPRTRVIVLVSKPPSPAVARRLLAAAQAVGKPVVVDFIGYPAPGRRLGRLHFADGLGEAAATAVELLAATDGTETEMLPDAMPSAPYLRGLFAGGTLAYEALQGLATFLSPLHSNVGVAGVLPLEDLGASRGHTVLDLGEDAFTVGRLHPMIDQELRIRRLRQEAADPEVGTILLDVVLGHGAHPDPAAELAPAIEAIRERRQLEVLALVVGTDEDPQGLDEQIERLRGAGARVFRDALEAVGYLHRRHRAEVADSTEVPLDGFEAPISAINVGLESFHDSLVGQQTPAVHVDWRPPAGGNERLMAILRKMRPRPDEEKR